MANAPSASADRLIKVVLLGAPGACKAATVKAIAAKYAHGVVRAGELGEAKVFRSEYDLPQVLPDGPLLRVRLFAISGQPVYNAVCELLLEDADGVVFCANLDRAQAPAVQEAFRCLLFNAEHLGMDLSAMPVAMHYHRTSPGPAFGADEMDQLLGIPPGAVARFVGEPHDPERLTAASEWIVAQIANGGDAPRAPSRPKRARADAIT